MKHLLLIATCAVLGCRGGSSPASHKAAHRAEAGDIAIVGATVIPMDREGALAGQTVVVRGDRILLVAPSADIDTSVATVIDGAGKYLVPALADMHVHLQGERDLALELLQGVTLVRDLFGSPRQLGWRNEIAAGTREGPTILTAGPIIDGESPVWPGSAVATTPDAARALVRAQEAEGYDWLKVYNGLSAEVYDAIIAEAKTQGLPVAGHVPSAVGLERVLASGQRTIEHFEGYKPFLADRAAIVAATVKAQVWNCPTLVVMDRFGRLDDPAKLAGIRGLEHVLPGVREAWDPKQDFRLQSWTPERFAEVREQNALRAALAGDLARSEARLVVGTDTGNPYVIAGFAVHDELALLVGVGLTPWQALRAATAAPAELLGTPGAFGVVAPGARADLLVVDDDPLADIGALVDPPIVMVRGKVRRRDELLAAIPEPAPVATDPFESMPAIEAEGTTLVAARYEVVFQQRVIGVERAVLSSVDGARVVRGQTAYGDAMKSVSTYRATRESLSLTGSDVPGGLTVARRGGEIVATKGDGSTVSLALAEGGVVAPQTIAEFFFYADLLADLEAGASRVIDTAEVMTERGVAMDPARFTFTRKDDAEGRRVYEVTGHHGKLEVAGSMTVDPDGAPADVTLTLRFGTFAFRRVAPPGGNSQPK